jgi:hypothetical protein
MLVIFILLGAIAGLFVCRFAEISLAWFRSKLQQRNTVHRNLTTVAVGAAKRKAA